MEHTKGKWTIKGKMGRTVVYLMSDDTYLADIHSLEDGKDNIARIKEAEANARLIAAAPIMYSFLRKRASHGDIEAKQIISKVTLD